jgi:hypothetical protein
MDILVAVICCAAQIVFESEFRGVGCKSDRPMLQIFDIYSTKDLNVFDVDWCCTLSSQNIRRCISQSLVATFG